MIWFSFKYWYCIRGLENVLVNFKAFEHGWKPCEYFVMSMTVRYAYKTLIIESVTTLAKESPSL